VVSAASSMVLVVEDDDSMRDAIERLLRAAGFGTAAYASAEALLAAGAVPGALCIVTDLKLPAMSGLELLTELGARGGWPPVIVITAHDAPGVRDDAARHGAAAYLAKPFHGSALLGAIESVVESARLA
jgi:FixJ family two-component response regulator